MPIWVIIACVWLKPSKPEMMFDYLVQFELMVIVKKSYVMFLGLNTDSSISVMS